MNKLLFIISILLIAQAPAVADGKLISPINKHIQYVGRWDKSYANNYHSYWGGAYFHVNFTGTTVKIKLAGAVNIYVKILTLKL